jgi:His-Xaa-Ser system radical SAM maturase HxsC
VGEPVIPLRGRSPATVLRRPLERRLWRIGGHVDIDLDDDNRACMALLLEAGREPADGYGLYLRPAGVVSHVPAGAVVELPPELDYLAAGDILDVSRDGREIQVLWRSASHQNFLLLTERCDNYCLMCCQPPRDEDDSWLLERAAEVVRLLPAEAGGLTITGGEPTIYGPELINLLRLIREVRPDMEVHLLSNGRRFAQPDFAVDYASVDSERLMVGIPLYGPEPALHDYVVQAAGAFEETVRGILNLVKLGQRVEIRIVIQRLTAPHLVELAEFISRNLPFVDQVVLMGLEMMGLARGNAEEIWIDPYDYRGELTEAAMLLQAAGIPVMIYNHQLCLLEPAARRFAVRSISDWKNEYDEDCIPCEARDECGGFFHSAKYRSSDHISPIRPGDSDHSDRMAPIGAIRPLRGTPVMVRSAGRSSTPAG